MFMLILSTKTMPCNQWAYYSQMWTSLFSLQRRGLYEHRK